MLKGLGNLGDMAKVMKQAQEMQQKMADAQEKLGEMLVEAEAGAGLVKVSATAKGEVKSVSIDPSIFVADDKELVEDLIVAAVKEAQAKAAEKAQSEMAKLTDGLPLPEGFKMPF